MGQLQLEMIDRPEVVNVDTLDAAQCRKEQCLLAADLGVDTNLLCLRLSRRVAVYDTGSLPFCHPQRWFCRFRQLFLDRFDVSVPGSEQLQVHCNIGCLGSRPTSDDLIPLIGVGPLPGHTGLVIELLCLLGPLAA